MIRLGRGAAAAGGLLHGAAWGLYFSWSRLAWGRLGAGFLAALSAAETAPLASSLLGAALSSRLGYGRVMLLGFAEAALLYLISAAPTPRDALAVVAAACLVWGLAGPQATAAAMRLGGELLVGLLGAAATIGVGAGMALAPLLPSLSSALAAASVLDAAAYALWLSAYWGLKPRGVASSGHHLLLQAWLMAAYGLLLVEPEAVGSIVMGWLAANTPRLLYGALLAAAVAAGAAAKAAAAKLSSRGWERRIAAVGSLATAAYLTLLCAAPRSLWPLLFTIPVSPWALTPLYIWASRVLGEHVAASVTGASYLVTGAAMLLASATPSPCAAAALETWAGALAALAMLAETRGAAR